MGLYLEGAQGEVAEGLWQRAPLLQLAGSPSLKTVRLTFRIQVSGLKCLYEQFFLLHVPRLREEGRHKSVCFPLSSQTKPRGR